MKTLYEQFKEDIDSGYYNGEIRRNAVKQSYLNSIDCMIEFNEKAE